MPEFVLHNSIKNGNKSIKYVEMNECKAFDISKRGVTTIYTDALSECNAVAVIAKTIDNGIIAILSHFKPTKDGAITQSAQIGEKLIQQKNKLDLSAKPYVFFNVRGYTDETNNLKPSPNYIFSEIRKVLDNFFKQGYKEAVVPYQNVKRPAFFSSANIFQFDPKNTNHLKMTTVGEKEHFIDLKF